jgi:hypothetical protein
MSYIQPALQICAVLLNIVLLVLLLRGFLRKYTFLFIYNLAQFLIILAERVLLQDADRGTAHYRHVYWSTEIIWDFLLFLLIADFIQRALAGRPQQALARKLLWGVSAAVVILPFVLYSDRPIFESHWFSGATQVINFGAAILTLVLWGALIASRDRDPQLMTVCAGLGITVAGAAFAWGVRQLAPGHSSGAEGVRYIADFFAVLTYLGGLALWCWAFRHPASATAPIAVPGPSPENRDKVTNPDHVANRDVANRDKVTRP